MLGLEFRTCECNGHKHIVLFENGHPYHYGFPAYTYSQLNDLKEHYIDEGLLDDEEKAKYRGWFNNQIKSSELPNDLPTELANLPELTCFLAPGKVILRSSAPAT